MKELIEHVHKKTPHSPSIHPQPIPFIIKPCQINQVLKSDGPPDPAAAADGYACSGATLEERPT